MTRSTSAAGSSRAMDVGSRAKGQKGRVRGGRKDDGKKGFKVKKCAACWTRRTPGGNQRPRPR
eukprot:1708230-Heterocapsa_arctica.AAC.1